MWNDCSVSSERPDGWESVSGTLRNLYRAGKLRVVRFGRAVRVPEGELERLCREESHR